MKSKYAERRWLNASEVRKVYGFPRRLTEELALKGKLISCEIDGKRYFRVSDLEALVSK